jgi:hypothetical protein
MIEKEDVRALTFFDQELLTIDLIGWFDEHLCRPFPFEDEVLGVQAFFPSEVRRHRG